MAATQVTDPISPATRERFYKAIIGEQNQDYYLTYFQRADERGYPPISWHWPVLFFGVLWFVYRRMYRWAIGSFLLPYVLQVVTAALERFAPGVGRMLFWIVIVGFYAVWLPLVANGLYYKQGSRMIRIARLLQPDDEAEQYRLISGRGGVHKQLPFVLLGFFTLLSMLMSLAGKG